MALKVLNDQCPFVRACDYDDFDRELFETKYHNMKRGNHSDVLTALESIKRGGLISGSSQVLTLMQALSPNPIGPYEIRASDYEAIPMFIEGMEALRIIPGPDVDWSHTDTIEAACRTKARKVSNVLHYHNPFRRGLVDVRRGRVDASIVWDDVEGKYSQPMRDRIEKILKVACAQHERERVDQRYKGRFILPRNELAQWLFHSKKDSPKRLVSYAVEDLEAIGCITLEHEYHAAERKATEYSLREDNAGKVFNWVVLDD